jgi:outer membrane protein
MKTTGLFAGLILSAALACSAHGQNTPFVIDTQPNYFAVAGGAAPDYVGSNDYKFVAGAAGRLTFGNHRYVELVATQLSGNLIDHEYWRLGPALNFRFGRNDVDDPVVDRMTDIDGAFELGLAGGAELTNGVNRRYRFRVNADLLFDVSGEHEGFVANLAMRYWIPMGKAFDLGLGVGTSYASENFNETYFGVNATNSSLSGLSTFNAGSGIKDVNGLLALVMHLNPKWHIAAGLRYQKLLSDAADSPVVDVRGSDDQYIAGIGFAYAWQ